MIRAAVPMVFLIEVSAGLVNQRKLVLESVMTATVGETKYIPVREIILEAVMNNQLRKTINKEAVVTAVLKDFS